MANLNDVLQGLVNINSKIANNINNLLDSIGEGFLDIGTLSVTNDNISLHDAVVLVNGENISVPELSTSFVGNKICFLEFDVDKNWILTVLDVVDDNFNYDLSVFKNTSRYFGLAQRFGDIFKDIRVSHSVSNDNTIVGALNGALKAIDYDNEMDLEINMDILSRISAVESDIQDLDIKKADKTYVDEVIANADIDIDGVVTAVDVGEIEGVEATYVTRAELDDALSGLEVDVDLTEYQKISDNSLTTSNKTIVGAINELFQNVDNGKNLIATSIGEPLSAEDTFQAMSNDINGLLSTFKTNMMKNGVTVESGDKFKQLIDKLATLSDSEGSDIQFSTGFINKTSLANESNTDWVRNPMTFDTPLPFTPTRVIVSLPDVGMNTDNDGNYYIGNISVDSLLCFDDSSSDSLSMYDRYGDRVYLYITNITNDGFDLYAKKTSSNKPLGTPRGIHWYAIGVGEEDTTLRDSLASILQGAGVNVTEEDDMASLIAKTDAKLDNSGGLDIISATELPTTGKENQICIIMENPIENYSIMPYNSSTPTTDSVILIYGADEPNYTYQSNNQMIQYNFNRITKDGVNFKSYYWKDSKWNILTHDFVSVVENGVTPTPDGTISLLTTTSGPCYQFVEAGEEDYLSVPALTSSGHITSTTEPINFDLYNKIEIDAKTTFGSGKALYIGFSTTKRSPAGVTSSVDAYCSKYTNSQAINLNVKTTYVYDISEFTGTGYLVLYTSTANVGLGIINIRLYL